MAEGTTSSDLYWTAQDFIAKGVAQRASSAADPDVDLMRTLATLSRMGIACIAFRVQPRRSVGADKNIGL